ncbi:hypothetical protein LTR36_009785 [Oleoguttula mirabilis]|uniref:Glycosyl transferase CAP10 domain-containing protein n=1 Tax=Oleoguttula mirabilis TaxID=1507867 RepID=A0AAV9J576_9PEZI|nr:hypothetical protein LTR36_009785 [Oleoguttula mirabilis]
MALVSAPALNSRFTSLVAAALCLIGVLWFFVPSFDAVKHLNVPGLHHPTPPPPPSTTSTTISSSAGNGLPPKPNHPIDHLIHQAHADFDTLLAKETHNVHDAAQAYRDRRGRQPPPHFDAWFAFAQNHSAVIVEDFFDQIYHDTAPFWGVPAQQIREQANGFLHRISVRGGNVTQRTDVEGGRVWMDLWADMVRSVAEFLPDVDLAINVMDESRIVVPWEEIDGYMQTERASRVIVPERELKTYYDGLTGLDRNPPSEAFDAEFSGMGPYWPLAVVGCPPGSAARKAYIETDFTTPPPLDGQFPAGSYEGYVQNWTLAKSPCDNAALQGLHGTFVEPISIANTKKFFPLFGGSKLPMNNEILLPPAMYWTEDPFYSGGKEHGRAWEGKKDGLIWRGAASGGRNKESNWRRFQRHRFVAMVNATSVELAGTGEQAPVNFALPGNNSYDLAALAGTSDSAADSSTSGDGSSSGSTTSSSYTTLANWIKSWSNAAVVHLLCFPEDPHPPYCSYTNPYFAVARAMPMAEQYAYKYLPDIDGNSFSGRYRAFLYSTSLPVKATIYQEWHDSRLAPWVHFVPMENGFADLYGVMEYFVGFGGGDGDGGVGGHDDVAKGIAMGGKGWAERVLRREDMQVYVFRLLLEYARLCDEERGVMGWREEPGG